MSRQQPPQKKKFTFPIVPVLLVIGLLVVLGSIGGFIFAASQESHDPFCGSCHTQPESTYLQQSTAPQPVNLASFHNSQSTLCIDCHSGEGIPGRITAEIMGARNAFLWYTGRAVQPAVLIYPIGDGNCLKCHQKVIQVGFTAMEQITLPALTSGNRGREEGRINHWHEFLSEWQAASPTAATCVSCHTGHVYTGTAQSGYMNDQTVQAVCTACHQAAGRGE